MKSLNGFLRAHTWVVFLGHQAFLFATAVGFLYWFRRLTGRAVQLVRDPPGVWGEAALAALSLTVIALMFASVAVLFALLKRKHDSTEDSPRAAGRRA